MSSPIPLRLSGVRKSYGRTEVLRGVDLEVPSGGVFGFVGLNGAGKTTTIECTLGLLRGHRGEIRVLGTPPEQFARLRGRVGVAFDAPCLPPRLSVRGALARAHRLAGRRGRPPAEVEELLGLSRYRSVATRRLSLGNRRRASIAVALIGAPELVVLDEPFSGLDAEGVDDVLAIIDELRRRDGITFFLSSHHLQHVERVCTHVGILHEGRIVTQGTVEELVARQGSHLEVAVDDLARARAILDPRSIASAEPAPRPPGGRLRLLLHGDSPAAINQRLVAAGIAVSELAPRPMTLEARFRELLRNERR